LLPTALVEESVFYQQPDRLQIKVAFLFLILRKYFSEIQYYKSLLCQFVFIKLAAGFVFYSCCMSVCASIVDVHLNVLT